MDARRHYQLLSHERPLIMHIDLNSCFATVEQQARPSLRGRPLGITNRISTNCCMIAASIEAKARGVKTGMGRIEVERICPDITVIETDPPKYHWVYRNLMRIMGSYSPVIKMKSIDEGLIDFHPVPHSDLPAIAQEIKTRLRADVGSWMRCNIGIAPNRFLAKVAAGLHKPDGLDIINHTNLLDIYAHMNLIDLTGIGKKLDRRLRRHGITTPLEFLDASEQDLRQAFESKALAHDWFERLRGYEVDDWHTKNGQVGRQFVLDTRTNDDGILLSRLQYLAQTSAMKLRGGGHDARGVLVWCAFGDVPTFGNAHPFSFWQTRRMFPTAAYTDQEIFRRARELFLKRPRRMVTAIGVTCYGLVSSSRDQLSLDPQNLFDQRLTRATDEINKSFGNFMLTYADAMSSKRVIKQKVPFGSTEYFDMLISGN